MTQIKIKGFGETYLKSVVLDNNGTISFDGELIAGVSERFNMLTNMEVSLHVITGDIHGNAKELLSNLPCELHVIAGENEAEEKLSVLNAIGAKNTVAIGNGSNDGLMLKNAFIGISVLGQEGLSTSALENSNIMVASITDALDLVINQKRLIGTLKV
jgi:P-type E1-E2 ATPase